MTESEVARLRQRIADEYLAAKYGLTGLASGVSKHEFITARMASMQQCHERLNVLLGNEQEATKLVAETLADLGEHFVKGQEYTYETVGDMYTTDTDTHGGNHVPV